MIDRALEVQRILLDVVDVVAAEQVPPHLQTLYVSKQGLVHAPAVSVVEASIGAVGQVSRLQDEDEGVEGTTREPDQGRRARLLLDDVQDGLLVQPDACDVSRDDLAQAGQPRGCLASAVQQRQD